ncbi:MAG: SDR family oxidoreductase [Pricia sp.]
MEVNNRFRQKIALVTGATSGIGRETVKELAALDMELYLLVRNRPKGEQLILDIQKQTANTKLHLLVGDLSSLDDVRRVAEEFKRLNKPLDILLNNAGVFNFKRKRSIDGFEEMFAVNHLAHFLLTHLLLDNLKEGTASRIVNVASGAHSLVKGINFEDLNFRRGFKALKVYSHSKLANLLFTYELAKRLKDSRVTVNAVDPGEVSTGLGRQNGWFSKILFWIMKPFLQSPQKGARTSIYVCTSLNIAGISGKYFRDCKEKEPKTWAKDGEAAKKLWNMSLEMVNVVSSIPKDKL